MTGRTHSPSDTSTTMTVPGAAVGGVAALLRQEGAVALALSVGAYHAIDGSWALFAALFLLPDAGMIGYLGGRRMGALFYNASHTYVAPAALVLFGWTLAMPFILGPALIWSAHIGFDRMLGYGLKYDTAFGATHLGWRGRRS
jgi:hypothetical protein